MIIAGPQTFEQPIDGRQQRVGIPLHPRNCIALPFTQRRLLIPFQALPARNNDPQNLILNQTGCSLMWHAHLGRGSRTGRRATLQKLNQYSTS